MNKYPKELFQLQQPTVCQEIADAIRSGVKFYNNVDTHITVGTIDASVFSIEKAIKEIKEWSQKNN